MPDLIPAYIQGVLLCVKITEGLLRRYEMRIYESSLEVHVLYAIETATQELVVFYLKQQIQPATVGSTPQICGIRKRRRLFWKIHMKADATTELYWLVDFMVKWPHES